MSLPTMHIAAGMSVPFLVWLLTFFKSKKVTARSLGIVAIALILCGLWAEAPDMPRYLPRQYRHLEHKTSHPKHLNIFFFHGFLDRHQTEDRGLVEGLGILLFILFFILFSTRDTLLKNEKVIATLNNELLLKNNNLLTNLVDLHCHVLPGIDDGPETVEEALQMSRQMVKLGVTHVVATPHLPWEGSYATENIVAAYEQLQERLNVEAIPLQIYLGAEIKIAWDLIKKLKSFSVPTLAQSRYFFLELDKETVPDGLEDFISQCNSEGFYPIIPHPERNSVFQRDVERLKKVAALPVLLQMSAGSLASRQGRVLQQFAVKLLREGIVNFIASDAHRIVPHLDELKEGLSVAVRVIGPQRTQAMVTTVPWLIVNNADIEKIKETVIPL